MRVLVTGVNGQLGHDVMLELARRGHDGIGSGSAEQYHGEEDLSGMPYVQMNITDSEQVRKQILTLQPEAVVHCAAWTAVDAAEDEENFAKLRAINVDGSRYVAEACRNVGAKMVYISTDYVFNGQGSEPWEADCRDFAPLNRYGQSKLDGELAVSATFDTFFIVRTAWVFGKNGNNFIKTMLKLGKTHDSLRVVNDQVGTPTYSVDLARLLVDLIETDRYGYYHATNEGGFVSWYDFACRIFLEAGCSTQVVPVSTAEYGLSKARRPFNSRLSKDKLRQCGFKPLPDWQDALARYLKELEQ